MTDLQTIKRALAAYRQLTASFNPGCLSQEHKQAKEAIAALERIEAELKERQVRLL